MSKQILSGPDVLPRLLKGVFYTYIWLREDGTPYYAGKGQEGRAFERGGRQFPPPPRDRILIQQWDNEEDALLAEKLLIAVYGRKDNKTGVLRNLTDGGEGTSGTAYSEEDKKRRGRKGRIPWNKGKIGCFRLPMSARKKISEANRLRVWTEEARKKNSQAKLGRVSWMKGKRHTPEANEKNRLAHIALWKRKKEKAVA